MGLFLRNSISSCSASNLFESSTPERTAAFSSSKAIFLSNSNFFSNLRRILSNVTSSDIIKSNWLSNSPDIKGAISNISF